jgi:hypothetical protein
VIEVVLFDRVAEGECCVGGEELADLVGAFLEGV